MDFSSLVLMEKDKETGFIKKELGSFEVNEGALYVKKLFVLDIRKGGKSEVLLVSVAFI